VSPSKLTYWRQTAHWQRKFAFLHKENLEKTAPNTDQKDSRFWKPAVNFDESLNGD